MNPLDPAVAALRCWEHEDCLEHPELALACADGRSTPVGMSGDGGLDSLNTHATRWNRGSVNFYSGDGWGAGDLVGGWGDGFRIDTHDGDGGDAADQVYEFGGCEDEIAADFLYLENDRRILSRLLVEGRGW